jgi:hypothetical protein
VSSSSSRSHRTFAWGVVLAFVAATLGLAAPSSAASKPPSVSRVHLVKRGDHTLTIAFAVPAAYYHRGAGVVVRLTRGKTAAARASAGYTVTVSPDHQARTGSSLTADALYTFAIWIHDGGKYSKRVVFRARTAKDTTPPDTVENTQATAGLSGSGSARVVLEWDNPTGDPLSGVRIVRNTRPTTTGGKVVNVAPTAEVWVDRSLPGLTSQGFSTAPLYYFVIPRDQAGHFARFYSRAEVVVGSRTISGTVSRENRELAIFTCCQGSGFEATDFLRRRPVSASVNGGAFTFTLPPGRYAVCDHPATGPYNDPTASCWVPDPGGGGHTVRWYDEFTEGYPPGNIDLTAPTPYTGITF